MGKIIKYRLDLDTYTITPNHITLANGEIEDYPIKLTSPVRLDSMHFDPNINYQDDEVKYILKTKYRRMLPHHEDADLNIAKVEITLNGMTIHFVHPITKNTGWWQIETDDLDGLALEFEIERKTEVSPDRYRIDAPYDKHKGRVSTRIIGYCKGFKQTIIFDEDDSQSKLFPKYYAIFTDEYD